MHFLFTCVSDAIRGFLQLFQHWLLPSLKPLADFPVGIIPSLKLNQFSTDTCVMKNVLVHDLTLSLSRWAAMIRGGVFMPHSEYTVHCAGKLGKNSHLVFLCPQAWKQIAPAWNSNNLFTAKLSFLLREEKWHEFMCSLLLLFICFHHYYWVTAPSRTTTRNELQSHPQGATLETKIPHGAMWLSVYDTANEVRFSCQYCFLFTVWVTGNVLLAPGQKQMLLVRICFLNTSRLRLNIKG